MNQPEVWTHVILNYLSQKKCEGISVYENGRFIGADNTKKGGGNIPAGDGKIVIGCTRRTGGHRSCESVKLDEFMMFDAKLSEEQIRDLSAHAWYSDTSGQSCFQ